MRALINRLGTGWLIAICGLLFLLLAGGVGWLVRANSEPVISNGEASGAVITNRARPASDPVPSQSGDRLALPGPKIESVDIAGFVETEEADIIRAAGLSRDSSNALRFDAARTRENILALPWVKDVTVRLSPTGILYISITERQPAAVWQDQGAFWLLDQEGGTIAQISGADQRTDLPLLIGAGAPEAMAEAWALLQSLPEQVLSRIAALIRRGSRRWDAVLVNGLVLKLPAQEPLTALRRFYQQGLEKQIAPKAVTAIDLRRPEEPVVLTLEPGAADIRLEMLDNLRLAGE